jgi:hypothetical protein
MANTIITKNSATATAVPTAGQLVQGELAVNVTDKRLFTENSGGTVVELGVNPSSLTLSGGTANGVTYLNGSKVLTSGSALTFDGSALAVTGTLSAGNGISYFNNLDANIMLRVGVGITSTLGTGEGLEFSFTAPTAKILSYNRATSAYKNIFIDALTQSFGISGSEGMRLTSTGLGIGTSSPAWKLDVQAPAAVFKLESTTGTNAAYMFTTNTGGDFYFGRDNSTGATFGTGTAYSAVLYSAGAYPMAFFTNSTERMRLDSSGNLGLGVTPSAWNSSFNVMQVGGSAALYGRASTGYDQAGLYSNARFASGTNDWRYLVTTTGASGYLQSAGTHSWYNAPSGTAGDAISFTQAMTLDASGRLGIGLTSMGRELQIYSSAPSVQLQNASSGTTNTDGFQLQLSGSDAYISNWENGAQIFATNATERMRIDSSGTVLIGESSSDLAATSKAVVIGSAGFGVQYGGSIGTYLKINPGAANGTVDFKFDARSGNYPAATFWTSNEERVRIDSSGNFMVGITVNQGAKVSVAAAESVAYWGRTTATGAAVNVLWNSATSGDNQFALFYSDGGPSLRGSITLNRGAGLIAFNTTSDYRAKEVSGSVQNALSIVTQLKPYMGKMKGATVERPMFIAHETQAIAPYAVTGDKDAVDQDGKPLFQQMDHSSLVPLLTAALQEALAKIESLTARVSALEGN